MVTNNAINANSTGLVRYNGSGTYDAVTTTNHDILIGAASNGITNVAPSATSGVPLISQGASSDPAFGTAVVAGGGTGVTSATAYAVLCGGTTSTGAFQSIASVGSSGQVLKSNGAGALPTFQTDLSDAYTLIQSVNTTSGTTADFTDASIITYNELLFMFRGVGNGTNNTLSISGSTDSLSTFVNIQALKFTEASVGTVTNLATPWLIAQTANVTRTGWLTLYNANQTNRRMMVYVIVNANNNADMGNGHFTLGSQLNSFRITASAGAFNAGSIELWGR